MGEAKRRTARRAANIEKPTEIEVHSRVDIVPMDAVNSYLKYEIVSEGKWRNNVPIIIIRPEIDAGRADSQWLAEMVAHMREVRVRYGPHRLEVGSGGMSLDVGLIDITVFFGVAGSDAFVRPASGEESDRLVRENLHHIDLLCGDVLHDQMVIAVALHVHRSNGSLLYHYHNLVFGLRHETRGNMDVYGTLNLEPLMKRLSSSGSLNVIGAIKH